MSDFPAPVVVVSKCLGFSPCRWNGEIVTVDDFLERLGRHARIVTVCPEVEIGLGVPRDKIRLVRGQPAADKGDQTGRRLVQPTTGRDLTTAMQDFARRFLSSLDVVDGFILKSRSPSCGVGDTKVFPDWESDHTVGRGTGLFAEAVVGAAAILGNLPVEDENRLADRAIRRGFLARLFGRARARAAIAVNPKTASFPPELL